MRESLSAASTPKRGILRPHSQTAFSQNTRRVKFHLEGERNVQTASSQATRNTTHKGHTSSASNLSEIPLFPTLRGGIAPIRRISQEIEEVRGSRGISPELSYNSQPEVPTKSTKQIQQPRISVLAGGRPKVQHLQLRSQKRPNTQGGMFEREASTYKNENEYEYNLAAEVHQQAKVVKNLEKWEAKTTMSTTLHLYSFKLSQSLQAKMLKNSSLGPEVNVHNINSITRAIYPSLMQHTKSQATLEKAKEECYLNALKGTPNISSPMNSSPKMREITPRGLNTPKDLRRLFTQGGNPMDNSGFGGGNGDVSGISTTTPKTYPKPLPSYTGFTVSKSDTTKTPMKSNWRQMFKNAENLPLKDKKKIEEEIHKEYTRLKTRMNSIKDERKRIYAENSEIYNLIVRITGAIKQEDERFKNQNAKSKKMMEYRNKINTQLTIFEFKRMYDEKEKILRQKEEKQNQIIEYKKKWEENVEKNAYYDQETKLLKTQLNFLKGILKDYYIRILKKGIDCRGKGLIWIIQILKTLNITVDNYHMPEYLDATSRQYLLMLSQKDSQLQSLKDKLNDMKADVKSMSKESMMVGSEHDLSNIEQKPTLLKTKLDLLNMKLRTINSTKTSYRDKLEFLGLNPDEFIMEGRSKLMSSKYSSTGHSPNPEGHQFTFAGVNNLDVAEGMKVIKAVDQEIKRFKLEIDQFKKTEIRRLASNLIGVNISGKQKAWLKKMTSALFGETSYELEFYKNIKLLKGTHHES